MPHAAGLLAGLFTSALLLSQTLPSEPTATQPTVKEPTLEELRAEHLALITAEYGQLPKRGEISIEKVLSAKIEDGNLYIKSLLEPTEDAVVYPLTDWPGWMQVKVGEPQSLMFYLKHVDLTKKTEIATYTTVITAPDNLQINRDSEDDKRMLSVTLLQSRQFADDNDDPIRLIVQKTSEAEGEADFSATYAAPSFDQLRQNHAVPVREYLAPIFKDLRISHLLRLSDPQLAWQVLGQDIEADPQVKARLAKLIEKLNSADFPSRAQAEDELVTLGAPAAAALSAMDVSRLSADARAPVDNFVRAHRPGKPEQIKAFRSDLYFLIDTLLLDDPALRTAAAARIGDLTGKRIDLPEGITSQDRAARVEEIRQQLLPTTRPSDPARQADQAP
ncbi:MAG: hypothetical protein H7144_07640 [Burkholderiales bacterium]|nr:hypothetical protein [Phycisphaerae bacterium]